METVVERAEGASARAGSHRYAPILFGVTVVWSACLLFLVEPLASKLILPWFGGSASVWITCLLFFQAALLIGYVYAHLLSYRSKPRVQAVVHTALLALSLAALPVIPNTRWQPTGDGDPTWRLLAALATSIGLPYILLSATSPLVQTWFARSRGGHLPYRYFALSNAGSLVALLSYPVLIEPRLTTHRQALLWSFVYFGFAALCAGVVWLSRREAAVVVVPLASIGRASWLWWILLSACPSALLLSTTTVLTENIAPVPLFWVLPLSVYLLTFILCFDSDRWYRRWIFLPALLPALGCLAAATGPLRQHSLSLVCPLLLTAFFVCCMTCHGELVRLKPAASGLTQFYLALSIGGAVGGLLIAVVAPHLLPVMLDFPFMLIATVAILLAHFGRGRRAWNRPYQLPGWLFGWVALVLLSYYLGRNTWHDLRHTIYAGRNFYGALRVEALKDDVGKEVRELVHGTITHGVQYQAVAWRNRPTTYYTPESGVGLAWRALQTRGPLRVGVIGLGTGTLAAYGRAGDQITFFEINPLVIQIARDQFSFLSGSPAHVTIVPGDARLTLQHAPPQGFDLLVVDAFTGDAIPVHLLTREALALYRNHLSNKGIIAFHVSNRYLDLPPVVAATAQAEGLFPALIENEDNDAQEVYASSYVLCVPELSTLNLPLLRSKTQSLPVVSQNPAWTDDYSNLWRVLELRENE